MSYQINWGPAKEDVHALDSEVRMRVIKKVRSIADQPFRFVALLEGYRLFKLRIGDYRAIMDIKQSEKQIIVVLVGHRSRVYQELARKMK